MLNEKKPQKNQKSKTLPFKNLIPVSPVKQQEIQLLMNTSNLNHIYEKTCLA